MTRNFHCLRIALIVVLFTGGCNNSPTDSETAFKPTLYLEGFLSAGNPVDDLFVGVTTPLYETVDRDQSGLSGAAVTLEVDGTTSELSPLPGKTGYYYLPTLMRVEPGKTYRLTVEVEDGVAQAETTVPFPPTVTASSTRLQVGGDSFSATWEGETGAEYMTETVAQSLGDQIPLESLLGGFGRFRGFGGIGIDTTGFAALRDSLAQASRWRYTQNQSTTLDLRQFSHYGTYVFRVFAIDKNYADFLISSNQDPQTLDEPRFHVSGGIGLFASMAADSVVFTLE